MWDADFDNLFRRQYKRLDSQLQKRVDDAVAEIVGSEDPTKLGEQKRGHLKHFYAYDLGRQYRIIYNISYNTKTIIFSNVGSHKQVYGKD
ncbi:type II toxin-antitoxin system RelE family toxin [Candidatus Nitrosotalea okcheonensis]|uniref:Uncharacterized protein n=1 Tax=Candidatus Nitrosotalea okcheonensis TaxID=1903276 RepID=A0A2H1FEV7_9ARCH|nr:type II toxin-antitoxin system mRNA interferase toxin, RelE/StbE family [Candidatus Nitrosotalea okcheonensis]SMH71294.1 conserved protein of unknown function [Candidatus Nitrosotalea okcheonensis]